jgi:hypothetical protein
MGIESRTTGIILCSLLASLVAGVVAHAAGSPDPKGAPLKVEPISFTILNPDNHEV